MSSEKLTVKQRLHSIIFEADTAQGKIFDVVLLWAIAISVLVVMFESVEAYRTKYATIFFILEWIFTILFTAEYLLRIALVKKPMRYIFSFYGIVDLLSILPSYLGLWFVDGSSLRAIRILRLLRIFRVLKLFSFLEQAQVVRNALLASRQKITVFLFAILAVVTVLGTVMYIIETPEAGFTSIPVSIYWAIVTMTTVGFGDITPHTVLGQTLASCVMIIGYAIIAVPTGIVTSELVSTKKTKVNLNTQSCSTCNKDSHDDDAAYCNACGEKLHTDL